MKRKTAIAFLSSFVAFNLFVVPSVLAATTATVTATVTAQNVAVSISDGSVAYGTLSLNASSGTNGSDTQTVTNDGNVAEDFTIKGQDSATWTLDSVNSTQDHYIHMFCTATVS